MNDSWDLAREHPMRTLVVSFATGLVGVALIMYFGPSGGDLYPSVLTGLCCGLIVAFVSRKEMQKGSHAVSVRVLR